MHLPKHRKQRNTSRVAIVYLRLSNISISCINLTLGDGTSMVISIVAAEAMGLFGLHVPFGNLTQSMIALNILMLTISPSLADNSVLKYDQTFVQIFMKRIRRVT